MVDKTWRCFDKTSYVFHVFRNLFFLISLITHDSYRNECHDNYLVPICPHIATNQYGRCCYSDFKANFVFSILGCNSCGYGANFFQ